MRDKPLFAASVIYLFLFFIALAAIFTSLSDILFPFITTVALVYFLSPIVRFFERFKIKSVFTVLSVYIVIILTLLFAVLFAAPAIYDAVMKIADLLINFFEEWGIETRFDNILKDNAGKIYSTAVNTVKKAAQIFIGAVAAFYILIGKDNIKLSLKELVPEALKPSFKILTDDIKQCMDAFFKGQIVIASILFVMNTVFLYAMGIPYALGLGFISALLDIVPYAGAFIAMALIMVVTLVSAPGKFLIILIGLLVIQQIENNVVTPRVSSNTLNIHPSVTVLALYLGAYGGFWGILLAVPLSCIFRKITERLIQSIV